MHTTDEKKTAVGKRVEARLASKNLTGPRALARAMAEHGHPVNPSQAMHWIARKHTPRPAAMRALAGLLGLPPSVLASWFLEVA